MLWDDSPRVRETDPVTSHQAADGNTTTVVEVRDLVIFLLREFGALTDEELIDHADMLAGGYSLTKRWSPSRLRTARHELTETGRVIATHETRPSKYGRDMSVWALA
jgi:hypothetical protein